MTVIICSGIHDRKLTDSFIENLKIFNHKFSQVNTLVLTYPELPVYSPFHIEQYLEQKINQDDSLLFIAFSAGVVGSIGAARSWHSKGKKVKALIAIDGWGVPLSGNFPVARLSHDYFTHWSSQLLGKSHESFYSQPEVEHLSIWHSPHQTWGWWHDSCGSKFRSTAADFLVHLLQKYGEI